jgi:hypothetical protein
VTFHLRTGMPDSGQAALQQFVVVHGRWLRNAVQAG